MRLGGRAMAFFIFKTIRKKLWYARQQNVYFGMMQQLRFIKKRSFYQRPAGESTNRRATLLKCGLMRLKWVTNTKKKRVCQGKF